MAFLAATNLAPLTCIALLASACASTNDAPDSTAEKPAQTPAAADEPPAKAAEPPAGDFEVMTVTDRVFSFRISAHSNLVIDTDEGWIVMDPMNVAAATALAKHLKATAPDKPLALIAYSHYHQDHAGGARPLLDAFGDDVTIVANRETPELYAGKAWAKPIVEPTLLIDPPWSKKFGELTFELRSVGPNHSSDMLIGWVPEEKVVYVVDFMAPEATGYRDLPGAHFPGYWDSQKAVVAIAFEHIVYGHGRPSGRQAVVDHIGYWDDVRAKAREAIAAGLTEDEAAKALVLDEKYHGWMGFKDWSTEQFRVTYRYEKSVTH